MSELKQQLRLDRVDNKDALTFLDHRHPLGGGSRSISFALGVFWKKMLEGVMTFGGPISNQAATAYGLRQCDVLELRKMWLSDAPPKFSESRALGIAAQLIKKRYPRIQLLLTYCDNKDSAGAYKASGWIPQNANKYVSEVLISGQWLTIRNANRLGQTSQATDKKYEHRRKWILPLTPEWRERIKPVATTKPVKDIRAGSDTSDTPDLQSGEDGSLPIPALSIKQQPDPPVE